MSTKNKVKYCPMSFNQDGDIFECLEEKCAWWISKGKRCPIKETALVLDTLVFRLLTKGWKNNENKNEYIMIDQNDKKHIIKEGMMTKQRFINGKQRMPDEKCKPNLGCATTRELLNEIKTRIEMDGNLDYRTVDVK